MSRIARAGLVALALALPPSLWPADVHAASAADALALTPADLRALAEEPRVLSLAVEDRDLELAVAGVVRVRASRDRALRGMREWAQRTASAVHQGPFQARPVAPDLADLAHPDGDFEVLPSCRPGDCKLKLAAPGIAALRQLDWSRASARGDAQSLLRAGLLARARGYARAGAAALPDYADRAEAHSPGAGFERLRAQSAALRALPALNRHLREYPVPSRGIEDRLYWSVEDVGIRPVTAIHHTALTSADPTTLALVRRQVYASHYFHARLELTAWLAAVPAEGPLLLYIDRARFDGKLGWARRALLERSAQARVRHHLRQLRTHLESATAAQSGD